MMRLHVHVGVKDLEESIRFYSTLFGAEPTKREDDYAKWMLDDPRVNFAISMRAEKTGVEHLGIQVEDETALADITTRLRAAEQSVFQEKATTCCYARSDKTWAADPQGVTWETFHTFGDATTYGARAGASPAACCEATCCEKAA